MIRRPEWLRWPLMTRKRHEELVAVYKASIDMEYNRAMVDGKAQVHAFMRDANANLVRAEGTGMYIPKVRAVFQQAEREFGPKRLSLSDYLYSPANIKEAIDAADHA